MNGNYQKPVKKLTLFFLSNPVSFNGQSYKKQKGFGTTDQLLFRLRNKFIKISLLVIYIIRPSLLVLYKAVLELFQKLHQQIYASQSMKSKIISLPFVLLNLESVERKRKNYKNLNISRTKRAFLMK